MTWMSGQQSLSKSLNGSHTVIQQTFTGQHDKPNVHKTVGDTAEPKDIGSSEDRVSPTSGRWSGVSQPGFLKDDFLRPCVTEMVAFHEGTLFYQMNMVSCGKNSSICNF